MKKVVFALAVTTLAPLAPLAANAQPVNTHDLLVAKLNAAYHTRFKTSATATAQVQQGVATHAESAAPVGHREQAPLTPTPE
jgi:hypothetical protein